MDHGAWEGYSPYQGATCDICGAATPGWQESDKHRKWHEWLERLLRKDQP